MATVNLYTRPEMKDTKGCLPIYLIFQDRGKKFKHFTGYKVPELFWDSEEQKVFPEYPESIKINEAVRQQQQKLVNIYHEAVSRGVDPDLQFVRNSFKSFSSNDYSRSVFFDLFEEFIEHSRETKKETTVAIYTSLIKDLRRFEAHEEYPLDFSSINVQFYDRFTRFLIEELNNTNNTISKKVKSLKAFLNYASQRKLIQPDSYRLFKASTVSPFKIILTENELSRLFNLNLSLRLELAQARDLFLFGCFTGMRYSDIQKLTPEGVAGGRVNVFNYLSNEAISVPLNNYAQMILKRYEGKTSNFCFPQLQNVYANKYVKELARMAGIDKKVEIDIYRGTEVIKKTKPKYELVTTETARFTFAAISLQTGMRPEILILILGQKNINNLLQYTIDNNPMREIEMLNCWNKKVF